VVVRHGSNGERVGENKQAFNDPSPTAEVQQHVVAVAAIVVVVVATRRVKTRTLHSRSRNNKVVDVGGSILETVDATLMKMRLTRALIEWQMHGNLVDKQIMKQHWNNTLLPCKIHVLAFLSATDGCG